MPEAVTTVTVLEELKRLHVAFPTHSGMKNNPSGTAEVYRDGLHGLTVDALRAGVRIIIENDTYFPKVSRLREVAWEWTKRHSSDITPELRNPLWCPRCGTECRWLKRWCPRVDKDGAAVMGEIEGVRYVRLDQFERLLCACAAACLYSPEEEFAEPWMRADRIKWLHCAQRSRPRARWARVDTAAAAIPATVATPVGELAETIATEVLEHV